MDREGNRVLVQTIAERGRTSCQASFPSGDTALTRLKVHHSHQSKDGSEVGKSIVPGPGSNPMSRHAVLICPTRPIGLALLTIIDSRSLPTLLCTQSYGSESFPRRLLRCLSTPYDCLLYGIAIAFNLAEISPLPICCRSIHPKASIRPAGRVDQQQCSRLLLRKIEAETHQTHVYHHHNARPQPSDYSDR